MSVLRHFFLPRKRMDGQTDEKDEKVGANYFAGLVVPNEKSLPVVNGGVVLDS